MTPFRITRALPLLIGLIANCAPQRGTIGAMLSQDRDGHLVVREAPPGLAAAEAGVRPGDEILLIDGKDARAMEAEAVHAALAGAVGSPVALTLIRDGEIVRVTLKRTPARPHK